MTQRTVRRFRLGMVGGGEGSFIGAAHRVAARLHDDYEFVAGALSSTPKRAQASGAAQRLPPGRCYADYREMARAEALRDDGIDVVTIVTPNHLHASVATAFLEKGIHVICDKPLAITLKEADQLVQLVKRTQLLFMVTYTYSGYPAVRQARQMVHEGVLGDIRVVQVDYAQDWLAEPVERTGQKQAEWRVDPLRAGPGGALGDIGTHALQLAQYVSGLQVEALAAELATFVAGRQLDDHVQMMLRFAGGARGALCASQVASGSHNRLQLHVYGTKAGLHFDQENPETLWLAPLGEPARCIRRGAMPPGSAGQEAASLPAGHPEGYYEAFGQLYRDFAALWRARANQWDPGALRPHVPGVEEGRNGVAFIDAALRSHQRDSAWTTLADPSDELVGSAS